MSYQVQLQKKGKDGGSTAHNQEQIWALPVPKRHPHRGQTWVYGVCRQTTG